MTEVFNKSLLPYRAVIGIVVFMIVATTGMSLFYEIRWWVASILSLISIWITFNVSEKPLVLIGAILAIWGSFLAWWCQGDFIFCAKGIDFYLPFQPFTLNNIGLVVVGLSIFTVLLLYQYIQFKHSKDLMLFNVLLLTILVGYYSINFSMERVKQQFIIGRIFLTFGFVIVVLGVLLQLSSVLRNQGKMKLWWGAVMLMGLLPLWVYLLHGY